MKKKTCSVFKINLVLKMESICELVKFEYYNCCDV